MLSHQDRRNLQSTHNQALWLPARRWRSHNLRSIRSPAFRRRHRHNPQPILSRAAPVHQYLLDHQVTQCRHLRWWDTRRRRFPLAINLHHSLRKSHQLPHLLNISRPRLLRLLGMRPRRLHRPFIHHRPPQLGTSRRLLLEDIKHHLLHLSTSPLLSQVDTSRPLHQPLQGTNLRRHLFQVDINLRPCQVHMDHLLLLPQPDIRHRRLLRPVNHRRPPCQLGTSLHPRPRRQVISRLLLRDTSHLLLLRDTSHRLLLRATCHRLLLRDTSLPRCPLHPYTSRLRPRLDITHRLPRPRTDRPLRQLRSPTRSLQQPQAAQHHLRTRTKCEVDLADFCTRPR